MFLIAFAVVLLGIVVVGSFMSVLGSLFETKKGRAQREANMLAAGEARAQQDAAYQLEVERYKRMMGD